MSPREKTNPSNKARPENRFHQFDCTNRVCVCECLCLCVNACNVKEKSLQMTAKSIRSGISLLAKWTRFRAET